MSKTTIVCAWLLGALGACATGSSVDDGTAAPADASVVVRRDANASQLVDAAAQHDAGMPHQDAQTPPPVDASTGGGGLFCSANSECTVAGECCVTLGGPTGFCGPGTIVLGQCVPN